MSDASSRRIVRWSPRTFLGPHADQCACQLRKTVKGTPSRTTNEANRLLAPAEDLSRSVPSSDLLQNLVGDIEVRVHVLDVIVIFQRVH